MKGELWSLRRFGLLAAIALLGLGGCGGSDKPAESGAPAGGAGTSTSTSTQAPADRAAPTGSPGRDDEGRASGAARGSKRDASGGAESAAVGGSTRDRAAAGAPGACRFNAPPGRLAVRQVKIELTRLPCPDGQRLAQAAAVGQPAGANLVVRKDGFECAPSSTRKGANVRYACARDGQRVAFRVVWSR